MNAFIINGYKKSNKLLLDLHKKKEAYWTEKSHLNTLALFHEAAVRVPAYKDFLKKNGIDPKKITTWEDFQQIPPVNKKNYLREYSLDMLVWDGTLKKPFVFTATSGSTGEPFYFMRDSALEWQHSIAVEEFLRNRFTKEYSPVLVIICFGMGVWIGGLIAYKAFEIAAKRSNLPVSIITPGINKKEIFNALKKLSPFFKQTIITGYPPFIKDIVDAATDEGISLKDHNVRFMFAAEAISEEFRDYIAKHTGIKDVYIDTMSVYGSADIGGMAFENTTSILIKRLAWKKPKVFSELFSPIQKTPTLAQFNPLFITFESQNGEILLTGNNALPLIRYAIGDHGGVFSYSYASSILKKHGINLAKEIKARNIQSNVSRLPFVYVYERVDLSATYYGLWIYPEWIRNALISEALSTYLTGKFTLITRYDAKQNQYLEINLEMRRNVEMLESIKKMILSEIVASLRKHSSEYQELSDKLKQHAWPKLHFYSAEDPLYFQPGIKQKWVKK